MQIPYHKPYIKEAEINSITETVRNGWLTMGEKTSEFERLFKEFISSKNAVAVNSCTSAMHLALKCVDLKEGDEVIVPAMTQAATAEVAGYFKAKIVFADVEKDTHLIDASKLEQKITKKTKVIMPVHYGGQPADMKEIIEIADSHNISVIEDAAHAFPSKYDNKFIGTIGHATCFSFYATKTLATGEGGMICTGNEEWAKRIRLLRLHGMSRDAWERENSENFWEYDVVEQGYKYNTTDINSAMGIEQLKKADEMHDMRKSIAARYNEAFKDHSAIILYKIKPDRETSWHLYPVKLNFEVLSIDRNRFLNELKKRGVTGSVHFIPLYRMSYYKSLGYNIKDFPGSEWIFERVFSLPIFPGMNDEEVGYVTETVLDLLNKFKR